MPDLKSCPFCGKPGVLNKSSHCGWNIYCAGFCGCQLSTNYADNRDLIKQWNNRAKSAEEKILQSASPTNTERDEICPECDSKMLMNPAGNWYCSNWPWCQGKLSPVS